ncbi:unnamed protein product [Miscanthus lutarioriparius]|uniref:Uncharacterized protein n=1 Tax=Miscanthus lutarioriparius TaxID=422564 RepID=A0A811ML15_9POAL|nr:unnamed protein product [Miscanthus lutarioriparius]
MALVEEEVDPGPRRRAASPSWHLPAGDPCLLVLPVTTRRKKTCSLSVSSQCGVSISSSCHSSSPPVPPRRRRSPRPLPPPLLLPLLSLSLAPFAFADPRRAPPEVRPAPGHLPSTVTAFSLASNGSLTVDLAGPCYVHFEYLTYFEAHITGVLRYGSLSDLQGVQVRRFLIWYNVVRIKVDLPPPPRYVYIDIGWITRKLPADDFQSLHACEDSRRCRLSSALAVAAKWFQVPNLPEFFFSNLTALKQFVVCAYRILLVCW